MKMFHAIVVTVVEELIYVMNGKMILKLSLNGHWKMGIMNT